MSSPRRTRYNFELEFPERTGLPPRLIVILEAEEARPKPVPPKLRARLTKYGLTFEQYQEMLDKQKGLCAICRTASACAIDHCHQTDVVRGLLCTSCNSMLGHAKDDIKRLRAAIRYLARSKDA